jgi:hypothetical protein
MVLPDAERVGTIEESKNCNQSVVPDLVVLLLGHPVHISCALSFSSFIFLTVHPSGLRVLMTILMAK